MKKTMIISIILNVLFSSCTETGRAVLVAALPSSDITTHELFDANCIAENVILDSFYLHNDTRELLPYKTGDVLKFKNESGQVVEFAASAGVEISHKEKITDKFCVNAEKEWSTGSEISEHFRVNFAGTLPSGDDFVIYGFMNKEKISSTQNQDIKGYYDDFNVYIANAETHEEARIRMVSWRDDFNLSREDILFTDMGYFQSEVNLLGQNFSDVYIAESQYAPDSKLKIYLQQGHGVIAFETAGGEIFVLAE